MAGRYKAAPASKDGSREPGRVYPRRLGVQLGGAGVAFPASLCCSRAVPRRFGYLQRRKSTVCRGLKLSIFLPGFLPGVWVHWFV